MGYSPVTPVRADDDHDVSLSRRPFLVGVTTLGVVGVGGLSGTAGASGIPFATQPDFHIVASSLQFAELLKLTASDGDDDDAFGARVSVSGDGTTALVGAPLDDDGGALSGSAYVYDLSQIPPTEDKLVASDADDGDLFGSACR